MSEARQRTAMISEATVISKPSSRGTPCICRHAVDNVAQLTVVHIDDALPSDALNVNVELLPCWMWLSSMAASRLFAAPIA